MALEELKDQMGEESNPEISNKRKLATVLGLDEQRIEVLQNPDCLGPVGAETTEDTQLLPKISGSREVGRNSLAFVLSALELGSWIPSTKL